MTITITGSPARVGAGLSHRLRALVSCSALLDGGVPELARPTRGGETPLQVVMSVQLPLPTQRARSFTDGGLRQLQLVVGRRSGTWPMLRTPRRP